VCSVLCILDDCVVIHNGVFSWSEDDTSMLKELVFFRLETRLSWNYI